VKKRRCRSCQRIRQKSSEVEQRLRSENQELQIQLAATVAESRARNEERQIEMDFYRKMMGDLVDDYLIRRNPFQVPLPGEQPK
jgi:hypothetical protein